jgi:hypothetical protein
MFKAWRVLSDGQPPTCDFAATFTMSKSARVKILEVHILFNAAKSMNYQLSGAAEARKLSPRSHSPKFNH